MMPTSQKPFDLQMKTGPISRQTQIRDYILKQITSGAWPENYRIPSEHELVAQLKVARMTVHHALRDLRDRGFLNRVQGIGTFVAANALKYVTIRSHSDIAAEIVARGGRHDVQILKREVHDASDAEAARLRVAVGAPVFHIRLLHARNGRPVQIEDRLINIFAAPDCPGHDFTRESPFSYLMRLIPYRDGEEIISARAATQIEQDQLKLTADEPVIEVTQTTWSEEMTVAAVILIHPAGRYRIEGRIASQEGRG